MKEQILLSKDLRETIEEVLKNSKATSIFLLGENQDGVCDMMRKMPIDGPACMTFAGVKGLSVVKPVSYLLAEGRIPAAFLFTHPRNINPMQAATVFKYINPNSSQMVEIEPVPYYQVRLLQDDTAIVINCWATYKSTSRIEAITIVKKEEPKKQKTFFRREGVSTDGPFIPVYPKIVIV